MSTLLAPPGWDSLSRAEKIEVVQALWDDIAREHAPSSLSDEQRRELERRADDADANPDDGTPWETVRDRVAARFRS